MATGWLRGTVKEVVSGDTLVIMGPSRGGPPPEKRLTLASLIAPRMVGVSQCRRGTLLVQRLPLTASSLSPQARRDGTTLDEPFAWQSREFLRKKCVGQVSNFAHWAAVCRYHAHHQHQHTSVTGACRPAPLKLTMYWKMFLAESLGPSSCRGRAKILRCWSYLVAGPRYTYTRASSGLVGHLAQSCWTV